MTKSGKMKTGILICAAAAALCVGSAAAYFTDSDTAVNTFTIGKVELDLQEPGYVPETDITPGEEIQKDPQIKNTGVNDEYVFLTVTIPYANITVAEADGHDPASLENAWEKIKLVDRPKVLACRTTPGKGIDFMENKAFYHAGLPDEKGWARAFEQVEKELTAVGISLEEALGGAV